MDIPPFPFEEPSAGWRAKAAEIRQMYVSLTQAGFSPEESFELVKVVIKTSVEQGLRDS